MVPVDCSSACYMVTHHIRYMVNHLDKRAPRATPIRLKHRGPRGDRPEPLGTKRGKGRRQVHYGSNGQNKGGRDQRNRSVPEEGAKRRRHGGHNSPGEERERGGGQAIHGESERGRTSFPPPARPTWALASTSQAGASHKTCGEMAHQTHLHQADPGLILPNPPSPPRARPLPPGGRNEDEPDNGPIKKEQ